MAKQYRLSFNKWYPYLNSDTLATKIGGLGGVVWAYYEAGQYQVRDETGITSGWRKTLKAAMQEFLKERAMSYADKMAHDLRVRDALLALPPAAVAKYEVKTGN